jgi:hypothetical protein
MSVDLFNAAKDFLEVEIAKFNEFLKNNIADHTIPTADISLLEVYVDSIKSKLTQDIGKSLEEAIKAVVVPNWKVMFEADNFIDTGKTLDEQKEILHSLLESLHKTGFVDNKFLPDRIVQIINRDFIADQSFKTQILIEELQAEYNLCNPDIDWINANAERMRVMFYSGLFVGNINKMEELLNKFLNTDGIEELKIASEDLVDDIDNVYTLLQEFKEDGREFNNIELLNKIIRNYSVEPVHIDKVKEILNYYISFVMKKSPISLTKNSKKDMEVLIQLAIEAKLLPAKKISMLDAMKTIVLICIGVAPSDDWMDLKEDMENNKITGITRAIAQGIDPLQVLSTTIVYLQKLTPESSAPNLHAWYIELMSLMYQDLDKCLEFCKSTSPYMFEVIFQRK